MANVVTKEQCPKCNDSSRDNLVHFDDGSNWCFACNGSPLKKEVEYTNPLENLKSGIFMDLKDRGITRTTCEFFGYQVDSEGTHIANYFDKNNDIVGQKIRTKDKEFRTTGKAKEFTLYGQWKYSPTEQVFITVTEGELDALSIAQVQGTKYPVVSIPLGAGNARKSLLNNLEYLLGFKYVILAFDNDEAGQKAVKDCVDIFPPGKLRVLTWPLKDANEMLLAGRANEFTSLLWGAREIKPDYLIRVEDILEKVGKKPELGLPYPWPSMTDITYGFRTKEITILVGAEGIGKTEIVKDLIFGFIKNKLKIGLFSFEQEPEKTILRLVGSVLNTKLHIPGAEWNSELIKTEAMAFNDYLYLCAQAGSLGDKELINGIRYWAKAMNVKVIIIDNLKGLCRGVTDENKHIKQMMLTFQMLARELDISFILVSHVSKDKHSKQVYVSTSPKNTDSYTQTSEEVQKLINKPGMDWESGRMPSKENVEGTGTVSALADYVFAIARNTMSLDPVEKRTTRVKCLKDRFVGSGTGREFKLVYTVEGKLEEVGNTVDYTVKGEHNVF